MRYLGGKSNVAKQIVSAILSSTDSRSAYLEPFLGGCNLFEVTKNSSEFRHWGAGDSNIDLILMWKKLATGWIPPEECSREEYNLKRDCGYNSAWRGMVGFGASYGGKFFNGFTSTYVYTNEELGRVDEFADYWNRSRKAAIRQASSLKDVDLRHCDYSDWNPKRGTVVYCDPPYQGTTEYKGAPNFDSDAFWGVMSEWKSSGVEVFVSELDAPAGWRCIWSKEKINTMDQNNSKVQVERLFH